MTAIIPGIRWEVHHWHFEGRPNFKKEGAFLPHHVKHGHTGIREGAKNASWKEPFIIFRRAQMDFISPPT